MAACFRVVPSLCAFLATLINVSCFGKDAGGGQTDRDTVLIGLLRGTMATVWHYKANVLN